MTRPAYKKKIVASDEARNRIVEENQGLVMGIIQKEFRGGGKERLDWDDLIQFGNLGLIRAAEIFDESKGYKFSTFAYYHIRQAIYKGIYETSHPVRVPANAHSDYREFRLKAVELSSSADYYLAPDEILDHMELGKKDRNRLKAIVRAMSADYRTEGDFGAWLTGRSDEDSDAEVELVEMMEQIRLAANLLPEPFRTVFAMRHGLDGEAEVLVESIAKRLKMPRQTVQYYYRDAIRQIQLFITYGPKAIDRRVAAVLAWPYRGEKWRGGKSYKAIASHSA